MVQSLDSFGEVQRWPRAEAVHLALTSLLPSNMIFGLPKLVNQWISANKRAGGTAKVGIYINQVCYANSVS